MMLYISLFGFAEEEGLSEAVSVLLDLIENTIPNKHFQLGLVYDSEAHAFVQNPTGLDSNPPAVCTQPKMVAKILKFFVLPQGPPQLPDYQGPPLLPPPVPAGHQPQPQPAPVPFQPPLPLGPQPPLPPGPPPPLVQPQQFDIAVGDDPDEVAQALDFTGEDEDPFHMFD